MLMQETGVDTIKQREKKIEKKGDFFTIYIFMIYNMTSL